MVRPLYDLENENEILASMGIDHPVRKQDNKQYKWHGDWKWSSEEVNE